MAILEIIKEDNPILRKKAKPVTRVNSAVQKLINDMFLTMYQADGVGLAAPQVGKSKRIIVVDVGKGKIALVNPEIVTAEGEATAEEGCLSIPGKTGDVTRAAKVVVKGLDETGKPVEIEADGLLARAFQHEIDHLNRILFIDKATNIREAE